jgi:hypothetical protein
LGGRKSCRNHVFRAIDVIVWFTSAMTTEPAALISPEIQFIYSRFSGDYRFQTKQTTTTADRVFGLAWGTTTSTVVLYQPKIHTFLPAQEPFLQAGHAQSLLPGT